MPPPERPSDRPLNRPPDDTDDPNRDLLPVAPSQNPWSAVLLGGVSGLACAAIGILAWTAWRAASVPDLPPHRDAAKVDLFRLPAGGAREAYLIPAGPDATGEPRLAERLFPGTPQRELVTLLLANVSPADPWDVDLAAEPLRCRAAAGGWEDVAPVATLHATLPAADALRLRSLGGGEQSVHLAPGTLRQILLALPPGRKMTDLTDVEWGGRAFARDQLELERLRRFREDPAGTTTGR